MQPEQEREIANLRALGLSPKQIARKLGLRVAEVKGVVQAQARESAISNADARGLAPIADCWVASNTAEALFGSEGKRFARKNKKADEAGSGLAVVLVARKPGYNRFVVCNYLVDYWCLGVKDAMGPKQLNGDEYTHYLKLVYAASEDKPQRISLAQAQAIVFGAEQYAAGLGLKPHPDFEACRAHLGEWDGQNPIECGRDGKPFYFAGPYDDAEAIMRTLEQNVGPGNFEYTIALEGDPDLFFD
ncbi:response regulator transcription factor [Synechococcus sp. PCC 7336]|uniref:response regulator transcription factor n=1 Tax=Synechococcus sp. PCC 7336 TaxID=195250 RepID=UPI0003469DDA|nr:response regulator transcription factor [Synechococcus sp. PCC 7336]